MNQESKLHALKTLMQHHSPVRAKQSFGTLSHDESIPLRAGHLIEVLGEGQLGFAANFIKVRPTVHTAWVMSGALPVSPMALSQHHIALSQLLFLEQVKESQGMDILITLLKSQLFEVLVFEQVFLPKRNVDTQIRKLSLLAETSGSILLLLSRTKTSSYGVNLRVETEDADGIRLQKVKWGG